MLSTEMSRRGGTRRRAAVARVAVVGALLVSLASMTGVASAATPKLVPLNNGVPYSGETYNLVAFDVKGMIGQAGQTTCYIPSVGNIDSDRPTLDDRLQAPEAPYCYEEDGTSHAYTFTFGFTRLSLSWNGQVRTTGKVEIHGPGPCVYQFKQLVSLLPPGIPDMYGHGSAEGSLVTQESKITCAPIETLPWEADVLPAEDGHDVGGILGAEIRG